MAVNQSFNIYSNCIGSYGYNDTTESSVLFCVEVVI